MFLTFNFQCRTRRNHNRISILVKMIPTSFILVQRRKFSDVPIWPVDLLNGWGRRTEENILQAYLSQKQKFMQATSSDTNCTQVQWAEKRHVTWKENIEHAHVRRRKIPNQLHPLKSQATPCFGGSRTWTRLEAEGVWFLFCSLCRLFLLLGFSFVLPQNRGRGALTPERLPRSATALYQLSFVYRELFANVCEFFNL